MKFDNGGAIAQKGFNYQNAVISLVAIRNYKRPNFEIYVEAEDDFEVLYDQHYKAYIQVKGASKLSLKKLLKKVDNKPSIIEKNLNNGGKQEKYKIVVYNFSEQDFKKMQEDQDELFEKSYLFSSDQKKEIHHQNSDNLSIVCTDFENDKVSARKYLVGELVSQNISVDNKSDILLDHIDRIISEKSEKILNSEVDRIFKRISAEELTPILQQTTALAKFNTILSKFKFTEFKNEEIMKEKNKIVLEHFQVRREVVEMLKKLDLRNVSEVTSINKMMELDKISCLGEIVGYAVCISAYCDVLEGVN